MDFYKILIMEHSENIEELKNKKIRNESIHWSTNAAIAFEKIMINTFHSLIKKYEKILLSK